MPDGTFAAAREASDAQQAGRDTDGNVWVLATVPPDDGSGGPGGALLVIDPEAALSE